MRPRKVLLTLVPTLGAAVALVPAALAVGSPPGSSYQWAQPNTVTHVVAHAQPPASVPIAPASALFVPPTTTSYSWAQPWGWGPSTAFAQPSVGIVP